MTTALIPIWKLKAKDSEEDLIVEKIYGHSFVTENELKMIGSKGLEFFIQVFDWKKPSILIRIFRDPAGVDWLVLPYDTKNFKKERNQLFIVSSDLRFKSYQIKGYKEVKEMTAAVANKTENYKDIDVKMCIKKRGTQRTAQREFQQKYDVLFIDSCDKVVQGNMIGDSGYFMLGKKGAKYDVYWDCY